VLSSSRRNVSQNGIAWTETRRLGLPRRAILVHSLFQTPSQPSCIPPCACKSRPWNENVSCGKIFNEEKLFPIVPEQYFDFVEETWDDETTGEI
jgi:hypothetical protein